MSSAVLLPASFAILLAGALLFTNAIEWFGSMVGLGQGAVGGSDPLAYESTAAPGAGTWPLRSISKIVSGM